jgi:hypothetical protein
VERAQSNASDPTRTSRVDARLSPWCAQIDNCRLKRPLMASSGLSRSANIATPQAWSLQGAHRTAGVSQSLWWSIDHNREWAARGGEALKRVALVSVSSTPVTQMHEGSTIVYFRTFFEELRRLGYVEGKNLVVLRFTSGGQSERIPDTAREVVAATPDVIFAFTSRMVSS